jgi:hypothetical protein
MNAYRQHRGGHRSLYAFGIYLIWYPSNHQAGRTEGNWKDHGLYILEDGCYF